MNYITEAMLAANNQHVTNGRFAAAFKKTMGKTFYLGKNVPSGDVWKARGSPKAMALNVPFIILQKLYFSL